MTMHIRYTQCPFCQEQSTVEVPVDAYLSWVNGALIQDAMPMLDANEREQFLTGICPTCWDKSFGE